MQTKYTVGLSLLAGVAIGAVAIQGLHAQANKPPIYIVNEVEITDQPGFQAYADAQSKLIQKHGGHYIIRGGKIVASLTGTPPSGRYTVYVFDNQDKMQAWRDDPGQKEVLATRDKVAKFRSFAVEGLAK
jgi:uncharacterized protein (DUF1330 family)